MATSYRALGTVVKLASTATLTVSLRLSDGTNTLTLDSGEAAYGTIAAGSYRLADFAQLVASKLLTWVTAAKAAAVTAGTLTSTGSPSVTLTFTPSTTAGGSLFSLAIGPIGATFVAAPSGTAAIVTHADTFIGNATDGYSPLGLVYETATGSTTRAGSVSSGTATWSGLYQPRSLFVFDRSEVDEGDAEEEVEYKAILLADGSGSVYASGRSVTRRTLRLVDLDESVGGRPQTIARVASIDSDRVTLTINAPSTATLSGISSPYYQSDLASAGVGRMVELGGWVSRLRSVSASSIVLAEEVPSSVTVNAGTVLNLVSEVHALHREAVRLGYLTVYETTDSDGSIRWVSSEYMLAPESARWAGERRDVDNPLYSYSWSLIRRDKTGLTLAS
jgi:hypothetical protein